MCIFRKKNVPRIAQAYIKYIQELFLNSGKSVFFPPILSSWIVHILNWGGLLYYFSSTLMNFSHVHLWSVKYDTRWLNGNLPGNEVCSHTPRKLAPLLPSSDLWFQEFLPFCNNNPFKTPTVSLLLSCVCYRIKHANFISPGKKKRLSRTNNLKYGL